MQGDLEEDSGRLCHQAFRLLMKLQELGQSGPGPHSGTFVTLTSLMREPRSQEQTLHPSMEIQSSTDTRVSYLQLRGTAGQRGRALSVTGPGPPAPHLGKAFILLLLHVISKDPGGDRDEGIDCVIPIVSDYGISAPWFMSWVCSNVSYFTVYRNLNRICSLLL